MPEARLPDADVNYWAVNKYCMGLFVLLVIKLLVDMRRSGKK
jgi:hypothetical protein